MTTGGTSGLVRRLGETAKATFLELFFDVVFVFALRALAQLLINKLNWTGAFQTLVLLLALGWVWVLTARITDWLDPRRLPVQLVVLATMVGALVLSAAVPQAFGKTGLIFTVVFLVIQLGRNLFLLVLSWPQTWGHFSQRAIIWHAAAAVPWLTGALASGAARTGLWAAATVLLYVARWFNYPVPGHTRLAGTELPPGAEHMAERHRALFVIGLGETVLAIGTTITGHGFDAARTVAFVVAFLLTALIWRIYIFRAGDEIGPAMEASANPGKLGNLVSYVHLIMIAGLVVTSAADELVINHPFGHPRSATTVIILGGPALFLAGRILCSTWCSATSRVAASPG